MLEQAGAASRRPAPASSSRPTPHVFLINLGLGGEDCVPHATSPTALRVLNAASGREIVRMPLVESAERRYGAPFWLIHRGDLQAALQPRRRGANSRIKRRSSARAWRISSSIPKGVTVDDARESAGRMMEERGHCVYRRRGLWSAMRQRAWVTARRPRFTGRTAWRGLITGAPRWRPNSANR